MSTEYSKMAIDLSRLEYPLYEDHFLEFQSQKCIIFGKNGTGKTSLCKLVSEQIKDMDVRIFNGFDNILGSNEKLNAVILGEDNVQIEKQIEKERNKQSQKLQEKEKIKETIEEPKDKSIHNLWTAHDDAKKMEAAAKKKYDNELTSIAASIKNASNPQIASPNYDRRNLKDELEKATLLSDEEKDKYTRILKSEKKIVNELIWPEEDYEKLEKQVNSLLIKKVKPRIQVKRIEGNKEKIRFAQEGLRLHEPNDVCAFCGNRITESAYEELQGFFSERDIKDFQYEVQNLGSV